MLKEKQIMIGINKVKRDKITLHKLARILRCSFNNLNKMLNREKEFPNIEKRYLKWLYEGEGKNE